MRATVGFTAPLTSSPPTTPHPSHPSAWRSPVPYLFGGLAAMLGLIAFALLILACSYWKLSGYLDDGDDAGDAESGSGDGGDKATDVKPPACYEPRIVVIMAGEEKPTFLATPISSRASSFGDHGSGADGKSSHGDGNGDGGVEEKRCERLIAEEEQNTGNDQSRHGQEHNI